MSYKIAIASGKGGTGKTSFSLHLYVAIQKYWTSAVQLVDCDVEEPNDLIFFPDARKISGKKIYQIIPSIDSEACIYCGKCQEYCEFNAIVVIPAVKFATVSPELCHSCGACFIACGSGAIKEIPNEIGEISEYSVNKNSFPDIIEGRLKIGSAMQTLLIRKLKKEISAEAEVILYDAAPGTSCPVVTTISDADFVVLVTEPTPFGLHDLKLSIEVVKDMKKEFAIFINKDGLGNADTDNYLKSENITILGRQVFDRTFASNYAHGILMENISEKTNRIFKNMVNKIQSKVC